jgi:putative ABC transport system permease protein
MIGSIIVGVRWHKVLADLWANKVRTLLVVLSIAAGTLAIGVVLGFGVVTERDMNADFRSANPHGAVISCSPFDDKVLQAVRRLPAVAHAEGRGVLAARIAAGSGDWQSAQVIAIPALDEMQIDRLRAVEGSDLHALGDHQLLIERTSLGLMPAEPSEVVRVELPGGKVCELTVAGVVHDVTQLSSLVSGRITVFVSPDTMVWLGGSRDYDQMLITVAERPDDESHIRAVAQMAVDRIEGYGHRVWQVSVPRPGEPPMGFVLRALLVVEGSMVVFLILLGVFLIVNTITALLSRHVRQIGVMKAVGARTSQVVGMYIVLVLSFGVLAMAIAVPLATVAVAGSIGLAGELMNFRPGVFHMPLQVLVLQAAVALGVPVLAALLPVINGARITVREAISGYGLGMGEVSQGPIDRVIERIRVCSRPTLLSLRNAFRRKGRLVLTLATLALAGALFIAVFNLRASFALALEDMRGYYLSDVNITLAHSYRIRKISQFVMRVPGVAHVEGWGVASAQVLSEDEASGVEIVIYAPPSDSVLIQPVLTAGRWLLPGDKDSIVVCNQLTRRRPDIGVADQIATMIRGREHVWRVVGVCQMPGDVEPGFAYTNYDALARVLGEVGRAADFRVVTAAQDAEAHTQVAQALEEQAKQAGIPVLSIITGSELRAQQAFGIDIFVSFMLMLAGLIALVGGLGLAGTMSMNVIERTREIGVMRAIGASDGVIRRLVIIEGLTIGALSWLLGAVLAVPVSKLFNDGVGIVFLSVPLTSVLSCNGFLMWLAGAMTLSTLASLLPAHSATRLTIREVLAYE